MFILPFLVSIPCDEDLETWREYYEQYFNLVFSFCKIRLNGDEDAAADCAHRVFDIALEKAETLRKHSNIGGWFYNRQALHPEVLQRRKPPLLIGTFERTAELS